MSTVTDTRLQAIRLTNTIMRSCFNAGILAQAKATSSSPIKFVTSTSDPSHPFHNLIENCSINDLRSLLFELINLPTPSPSPTPSQPEGETRAHTPGPSGTLPPLSEH